MNPYQNIRKELENNGTAVWADKPLADYTTFGIGGPARLLAEIRQTEHLRKAVQLACQYRVPYKIIGNGSNLIVSDSGFDGFVIINQTDRWEILDKTDKPCPSAKQRDIRFTGPQTDELAAADIHSGPLEDVLVRVDSGLKINTLAQGLYRRGISGLQWFAGIPATVGGAIYMNMHGARRFFGDILHSARLTDGRKSYIVDREYFKFGYDRSILQTSKEIVLWAELCLKKGGVASARKISKAWSRQKAIQPQRSAGCVFQNLRAEEQERLGLPTPSVGYVIDRLLGLKGTVRGGACISSSHAAFIENKGKATCADVLELIELIKSKAQKELGLELRMEAEILGTINKE